MKVLVTGSSGFIGKAVCAEIDFRGGEVVPFDRPKYSVTRKEHLTDALIRTKGGITGIINLAGKLGTPELFGSEYSACEVNVMGAINVYDFANSIGRPVVQIGTGHKGQPNPYAISKGCAEDIGLARANYLGQQIAIVRAYHVYGPGQAVGPPHGDASVHKFFPTFACRAFDGMALELCGGGNQMIDPVHVDDVAKVLVDALDGPYGRVIEAGNGNPVSVQQVALDIRGAVGHWPPAPITLVNGRDGEPLGANVVAAEPRCSNPWPYKLRETLEWYRKWLINHSSR